MYHYCAVHFIVALLHLTPCFTEKQGFYYYHQHCTNILGDHSGESKSPNGVFRQHNHDFLKKLIDISVIILHCVSVKNNEKKDKIYKEITK